jgi:hypothetical protein
MNIFKLVIFVTTALTITQCYTVLGPYKLIVDSSFVNITTNSSIVFDFTKQIINGSMISN